MESVGWPPCSAQTGAASGQSSLFVGVGLLSHHFYVANFQLGVRTFLFAQGILRLVWIISQSHLGPHFLNPVLPDILIQASTGVVRARMSDSLHHEADVLLLCCPGLPDAEDWRTPTENLCDSSPALQQGVVLANILLRYIQDLLRLQNSNQNILRRSTMSTLTESSTVKTCQVIKLHNVKISHRARSEILHSRNIFSLSANFHRNFIR